MLWQWEGMLECFWLRGSAVLLGVGGSLRKNVYDEVLPLAVGPVNDTPCSGCLFQCYGRVGFGRHGV